MQVAQARQRAVTAWRWQHRHRIDRHLLLVVLALVGATLGILLAGNVHAAVGPVKAEFALRPSLSGGTEVRVPPLGKLTMASHLGPLRVEAKVTGIDLPQARQLISGDRTEDQIADRISDDVRSAMLWLVLKSLLAAVVGAVVLVGLAMHHWRPIVAAVATTVLALVISSGVTALTWNTKALSEPKFTGLLASAPTLIGSVQDIQQRFKSYREELSQLVTNVSKLYDVTSTLPSAPPSDSIEVLWVSDIHDNPEAFSVMSSLIAQFHVRAVVDTGDLSDHGTSAENSLYSPIGTLGVPYVFVRGNHDSTVTQRYVESLPNTRVLDDGEVSTVAGIRWAGIGDPLFTPDKTDVKDPEADAVALTNAGEKLAAAIDAAHPPADVALVHDPVMAQPLFGHVPLVLDGHLHHRESHFRDGTLELTQGSTGGAGLRNLEGEKPLPLELSILYFSPDTHRLIAVDDVTVAGLGAQSVQIQRHSAGSYAKAAEPTPSPSPS